MLDMKSKFNQRMGTHVPHVNSKLNQDGTHVPNMNSNINQQMGTCVLNANSKF